MKTENLINTITTLGKDVFAIRDLRQLYPTDLNIKTTIKRLVDRGILNNVTRGTYQLKDKSIDPEKLATQLYAPSYVSFESVLSKYGIINQGFNKVTLATTRHSKKTELSKISCEYIHLKPNLFFGFDLVKNIYLAQPEKALLDELYLISLGKRKINTSEWVLDGLDFKKIKTYSKLFPTHTQKLAKELLLR